MEYSELGRFYATTFCQHIYEFIVYSNNKISCPQLNVDSISRVVIKPRFELFCDKGLYVCPAPHNKSDGLIKTYTIEDKLFNYLKENNIIIYSTDMAYLYDFKDKKGYDYGLREKTPFKRVKNKRLILDKQKRGIYN